jgi:RNA polymerase sigma-70 factor, ECF subfamily
VAKLSCLDCGLSLPLGPRPQHDMTSTPLRPPGNGFADADLIARVIAGDDRNAFAELVRRHQSALRASIRKMTHGQIEFSDDIAQETFILAWKNIKTFRNEAKFSTWLYRIAFNVWQSEIRKKRETLIEEDAQAETESHPSEAELTGVRRDLTRAMQNLTDGERNAILQCYYNDLSHEEAAYVLGIPLGTVKTNVLKAKEKMRGKLSAYLLQDGKTYEGASL